VAESWPHSDQAHGLGLKSTALPVAVSFKKMTKGVCRGRTANAKRKWIPDGGGY